jgi:hypothetical protein
LERILRRGPDRAAVFQGLGGYIFLGLFYSIEKPRHFASCVAVRVIV